MDINNPNLDKNDKFQLAAYKDLRSQIKYELELGIIDQEKYYEDLARIRDKYLSSNTDEWRRASIEIHAWEAEENKRAFEQKKAELEYQKSAELIDRETYYKELTALRDKYLTEDTNEWRKVSLQIIDAQKDAVKAKLEEERRAAEEEKKQRAENYNSAREDLKYQLDLEIIDKKTYYEELKQLQSLYLDESSAEWRKVTLELRDWEVEQLREAEREKERIRKEALAKIEVQEQSNRARMMRESAELEAIRALERADIERTRAATIKAAEDMVRAEQVRVNNIVSLIDEEIQKRRELREDEQDFENIGNFQKSLDAARGQLSFARDDSTRYELQKEIYRLEEQLNSALKDRADTLFSREMENAKKTLQEYKEQVESVSDYVNQRMQSWNGNDRALNVINSGAQNQYQDIQNKAISAMTGQLTNAFGAASAYVPISRSFDASHITSQALASTFGGGVISGLDAVSGLSLTQGVSVSGSSISYNQPVLNISSANALTTGQIMNLVRKMINEAWGS